MVLYVAVYETFFSNVTFNAVTRFFFNTIEMTTNANYNKLNTNAWRKRNRNLNLPDIYLINFRFKVSTHSKG